jgi:hypothetical protein
MCISPENLAGGAAEIRTNFIALKAKFCQFHVLPAAAAAPFPSWSVVHQNKHGVCAKPVRDAQKSSVARA